ncbi:hypothetical protein CAPTEDRAFT_219622 [Capitella teleta]|uniref:Lipid-binding serum glycoprotein C-terminal domain-containing protein n=1 Tax=Capitella teleta TaxID=283909 RepID=R7UVP5_CAPTE|nr:hypothetical protein CAPTEDRAFT_219622 [Capitella teleta]|eukprot:ELU08017.1 hypothetical protein CAPTEDRAFT_219622 [Capitella teleta]
MNGPIVFCLLTFGANFCLALVTVAPETTTENDQFDDPRLRPGVRARVTQHGMDLVARLVTDGLMQVVPGIDIPDITASAAGSTIKIHNMHIKEFSRPTSSVNTNKGKGFFWNTRDVQMVLEADFELKASLTFFTVTKRGTITARASDLVFTLLMDIGRDSEGRMLPYNYDCNAYGSNIDISFEGGLSSIFNFVFRAFRGQIKDAIKAQICAKAEEEITNQLIPAIYAMPVTVTVDDDFVVDYRLVKFPTYADDYFEFHVKVDIKFPRDTSKYCIIEQGAVFLKENITEPGFWPPQIPAFANDTERMVYIYVTDYVMNSGFTAAFKNGKLAIDITENMIPGEMKQFLSTSCSMVSLCIGAVFPQLEEMFPNQKTEMDVFATEAPVGRIDGNEISLQAKGEAQFYVAPSGVRANLFTINMTISARVGVSIVGNRIVFDVVSLLPEVDIKETNIGEVGSGFLFETVLRIVMRQFVMPKVVELGRQGILLPQVPNLNFTNSEIISHVAENIFIIATDVDYTIPEGFVLGPSTGQQTGA